jgi:hypothetical protein
MEQISEVKTPISVLGAEIDQRTPPELVKKFEDILSTKPEVTKLFFHFLFNVFSNHRGLTSDLHGLSSAMGFSDL